MQIQPAKLNFSFNPLLLIAPFFFWGTAMVAMKGVLADTTPFFVAGVRLVPAGILVLAVAALLGKSQPRSWQAWGAIAAFALVDGALFQGFLAAGLDRTGAGLGSVIIDSQPLVVALLSRWLFAEIVGFWGWLGLSLGIIGIGAIGLPDAWILGFLGGRSPDVDLAALLQNGTLLMFAAAISMAVGTVMVPWVSRHVDPVVATGWHMILGGIPLFVLSATRESEQWIHLSASDWLALAYTAVFGSAIAYGLFFYFASRGNLTSLSALTFLTPVFALLFGGWLLHESLSPLQWGGVALTLVSIYLINQRNVLLAKFNAMADNIVLPGNSHSWQEKRSP